MKRRTIFVFTMIATAVVLTGLASLVHLGWPTAVAILTFEIGCYVAFIVYFHDGFLGRILLFGISAGVVELLADKWLVEVTKSLVYAPNEPFLVRSPVYMPFAWASVIFGVGYVGWWIAQRLPLIPASLLAAGYGAINIPLYEQAAKGADWWLYRGAPALFATPYYIVAGEFLIVLPLPFLIGRLAEKSWKWAVALGAVEGLWIWAAYAVAWSLFR